MARWKIYDKIRRYYDTIEQSFNFHTRSKRRSSWAELDSNTRNAIVHPSEGPPEAKPADGTQIKYRSTRGSKGGVERGELYSLIAPNKVVPSSVPKCQCDARPAAAQLR